MANDKPGLLGIKLGMTQIYGDDNMVIPVTIVETSENKVVAVKTTDGADGYAALQLGLGERKPSRTTSPMKGHFAKAGLEPQQYVREIRVTDAEAKKVQAGQTLKADDVFTTGDYVDITGTSKGRGFTGVMKRYNFKGFIRTHGTHEYFRHGGSIGTRLTPGMVFKGQKMPGHMGSHQVTIQNHQIVKIDTERGLVYIRGGVPGANGGLVVVRKAVKK